MLGDRSACRSSVCCWPPSALGRAPSSRLAEAAGVPASSVTRLTDRLAAAGLVARGGDARSRSIVTVEITGAGRDLVAQVVARRHELLAGVLAQMEPGERAVVAAGRGPVRRPGRGRGGARRQRAAAALTEISCLSKSCRMQYFHM